VQITVQDPIILVQRKKYNWWPVIIACATVGALLFIGTIAAVVVMRKRKIEETPIRPAEEEKPPQEERPTEVKAEVRMEPIP
jgi:Na+/H+ antiporter NhaD/arsenite permease-like protein